ncbi:uncharacterized protein A4U43_C10F11690 [Asparagus officinalis]|uniref:Uncharacterized protein n=1 Tax=Asparagus officinalis TaxID=4686 RepID=A0A5P1E2L0_ASPOF|nr:uncharacterized protein A4U43_C10F11690 [Asparagus officinalis]
MALEVRAVERRRRAREELAAEVGAWAARRLAGGGLGSGELRAKERKRRCGGVRRARGGRREMSGWRRRSSKESDVAELGARLDNSAVSGRLEAEALNGEEEVWVLGSSGARRWRSGWRERAEEGRLMGWWLAAGWLRI